MSKLLHLKASRTRILTTFPSKSFGKDGDIVVSNISGKGTYICVKSNGVWYTANRLSELSKVDKTPLDIIAKKLRIKDIKSSSGTDKFVVSEGDGELKYRTGEEVLDDLGTDALSINYKTAYCSLAQYNDKETCESNGGTWYYSENDSHDSISNTAENELLSIGSSIGKIDAESTLTYDGSTLEIKYNSDYDDNWQTSAQDTLLKLSYDSSNNALFGVNSSGNLTLDVDGDITLDAHNKQFYISRAGVNFLHFNMNTADLKIMDTTNQNDYFNISVDAEGATTISTVDADTAAGHLTLAPDGDLIIDPAGGDVSVSGAHLAIDNGKNLYFDGGSDTYIKQTTSDVLDIYVGALNMMKFTESTDDKVEILGSDLEIDATKSLYFDGGGDTYMHESEADVLRVVVGGDVIMHIEEKGDDGNEINLGSSCVGFNQLEPTYDATTTVVDFRHSNKQNLTFGSGSITHLTLYFPLVSGNFQLLIKQDGTGSRTITNYKVYEFDESSADGSAAVKFAGGSNPTLTTAANHVDILSFYWDADNEIAYGVATLDFQD